MVKMGEVTYTLKPVEQKQPRSYRKQSKYDPIITDFVESEHSLVEVSVNGKEPNYIRIQLDKRLEARDITGVSVSVSSGIVYLEKVDE